MEKAAEYPPLSIREVLTGQTNPRAHGKNMETLDQYPHLFFSNMEHYKAAAAYAIKMQAIETFNNSFASLERVATNIEGTAEIFPDITEHSFYFITYNKDGKFDMNGGIIMHGGKLESFGVELDPQPGVYWSIHT